MHLKLVTYLLYAFGFILPQVLYAQKNAPVAGDAAQLVDLLKKDYNSIDPTNIKDELVKDRSQVIAIFKSYMTDEQKDNLFKDSTYKNIANNSNAQKNYKIAQQSLSTYSALNISSPAKDTFAARAYTIQIAELSKKVEDKKENVYYEKFKIDSAELLILRKNFSDENKYAEFIINQFINKYETTNTNGADAFAKSNPNNSLQKGIPFLGGDMGFETAIEGLSKFLAKRIKEELTTEVINKIKERLENPRGDDPLAELKVLLPRTNAYLLTFKASQVTSFPNEIKQYIEDDFNHILENMGGLRYTPRIQRLITDNPDADFALEALELIPILSKIKNPIDYFEIIGNSRNLSRWSESDDPIRFNIANTLKLSCMLAHSFTIIENGQSRFAGNEFISTYSSDLNFFLIYVAFLYQQNIKYYDINFIIADNNFKLTTIKNPSQPVVSNKNSNQVKLPISIGMEKLIKTFNENKIEEIKDDRKFFETIFNHLGQNTEKVYASALDIRKANKIGAKIGADTVYTFIKSIIDLVEEVTFASDTLVNYFMAKAEIIQMNMTKISIDYSNGKKPVYTFTSDTGAKNIHSFQLKKKTEPYFKVANKTNDIVLDLQKKNYATAIIKALEIPGELMSNNLSPQLNILKNTITLLPAIETQWLTKNWYKKNWYAVEWCNVMHFIKIAKADSLYDIGNKIASSSNIIYDELNKIKNYYFLYYENDEDQTLIKYIVSFMELVNQMKVKGSLGTNGISRLTVFPELFENKTFQRIVISFYSNLRIDEFAENLEKEMNQMVLNRNGISKNIFRSGEADSLKINFLNYVDAAFNYLTNNDKEKFINANSTFKNTTTDLLLRVPEKSELHINESVLKLIHFINDMALSENSDDIEKAIEAFALPSGSYSNKREAKFNISVNSFPGILPALEITWKDKNNYSAFSPAFTAPVGLSFTWGSKSGFSQGIFVPVIDLGAITSMYFSDNIDTDTTSVRTLPEFSFLSIFSPGVYYHLGIKKSPLSFNVGAQYGPGLREITDSGDSNIYESIRIGIGIVLDIPLLNLYTKPRFD